MCLKTLFGKKTPAPSNQAFNQLPCPSDIIPREAVSVNDAESILTIDFKRLNIPFTKPPVIWPLTIADTNSMNPVMDASHNPVAIRGTDPENQKLMLDWLEKQYDAGNRDILIVCFREAGKQEDSWVIHRLYQIIKGSVRQWQLKGDNTISNTKPDPWILQDEHIAYLVVSIGY